MIDLHYLSWSSCCQNGIIEGFLFFVLLELLSSGALDLSWGGGDKPSPMVIPTHFWISVVTASVRIGSRLSGLVI